MDALLRLVRKFPLIPVIGDGRYQLSPVFVDDLLDTLARAATSPVVRETLAIGGPETLNLNQVIDRAAAVLGRRRFRIHAPVVAARLAIAVAAAAGAPVYRDQIPRLVCRKDLDSAGARASLGHAPRPLEAGLAAMGWRAES